MENRQEQNHELADGAVLKKASRIDQGTRRRSTILTRALTEISPMTGLAINDKTPKAAF